MSSGIWYPGKHICKGLGHRSVSNSKAFDPQGIWLMRIRPISMPARGTLNMKHIHLVTWRILSRPCTSLMIMLQAKGPGKEEVCACAWWPAALFSEISEPCRAQSDTCVFSEPEQDRKHIGIPYALHMVKNQVAPRLALVRHACAVSRQLLRHARAIQGLPRRLLALIQSCAQVP